MKKFHTVYDIRDQPLIPWQVYLFFTIMALALWFFFYARKSADQSTAMLKYVGLGAGILFFFIFLYFSADAARTHYRIKRIFDEKNYSTVEGRVQDFEPKYSDGHKDERFRVGNLYFTMEDDVIGIMGYNKSAGRGGVFRANLYVRILYPTYGQICILRLETE